ncbi:hypothetical protein PUN28_012953 [Cardiocondyla obscurior]|uniref:Uncharacterized protein n=1 Tax=Cardiocondyla obscurior TaxID=286306 RepID=A0AAW2F864_9HYME
MLSRHRVKEIPHLAAQPSPTPRHPRFALIFKVKSFQTTAPELVTLTFRAKSRSSRNRRRNLSAAGYDGPADQKRSHLRAVINIPPEKSLNFNYLFLAWIHSTGGSGVAEKSRLINQELIRRNISLSHPFGTISRMLRAFRRSEIARDKRTFDFTARHRALSSRPAVAFPRMPRHTNDTLTGIIIGLLHGFICIIFPPMFRTFLFREEFSNRLPATLITCRQVPRKYPSILNFALNPKQTWSSGTELRT